MPEKDSSLNSNDLETVGDNGEHQDEYINLHILIEKAFIKAKMRSGIGHRFLNGNRLNGIFMSAVRFYKLRPADQKELSRLRMFFIYYLKELTRKPESEIYNLINVHPITHSKLLVWNKVTLEMNHNYKNLEESTPPHLQRTHLLPHIPPKINYAIR